MVDKAIEVRGLRELREAMKAFPDKLRTRLLNRAVAAGARVVAAEVRQRAPVRQTGKRSGGVITAPGALKRNVIGKRGSRRYQAGADARYIVGVRHGKANLRTSRVINGKARKRNVTRYDQAGQNPFYYRFQEKGFTAVGRRPARGRSGRLARRSAGTKVPGKRFMRDGLIAAAPRALERMKAVLAADIARLR